MGGTLSVNDPDSGEAVFNTPASLAGTYGTFTFNTATGVQWAMYEIMIGAGAGDTTQAEVLVTS